MALCVCGGCATTITPPRAPPDPIGIYVTDYGRHSSVLLPDPRGHLTEYAFGDWDWFALRHTAPLDAIGALFFSKYSTLGRRQLKPEDGQNIDRITAATRADKVAQIQVSRQRAELLLARLDAFYEAHIDTVTYTPASGLWFVRYPGNYGLFYNCNHVTAAWLRELGCEVRGTAMTSRFVIRLRERAAAKTTTTTMPASNPARAGAKLGNRLTYGPAGG